MTTKSPLFHRVADDAPLAMAWAGILVAAFLVLNVAGGCATTDDPAAQAKQCANYAAIYEAYLIARENGNPSEAEITAARVAGVFLRLHCGWEPAATRGDETPDADWNGVPILAKP